ncbi:MAG: hypothetical protein N2606_06390 [Candidatus Omnitrophica bacterium]|nr:hypothetical protein [Candidatus Omnitrophota bacterium]
MKQREIWLGLAVLILINIPPFTYAEKIQVVLTGQSHALLYPCHCPIEPDGGISRRSTFLNELRRKTKNILLLDSGAFLAGGNLDQNSFGQQMDKIRSQINVKAMQLMGYDAVSLGEDEFNFGVEFLVSLFQGSPVPVVASNLVSDFSRPYVIKRFGKNVVGIVAAVKVPANIGQSLNINDPRESIRNAVALAKQEGAGIIIFISHLDEQTNRVILNEIPQINILIDGSTYAREQVSRQEGSVIVLQPRWEARRLVIAELDVKDNKLLGTQIREVRMSDKIKDDKRMLALLPACFGDSQCKKEGMIGICKAPGTTSASCEYKVAPKVSLTVIDPVSCRTCNTQEVIRYLKTQIPGLVVKRLNYPSQEADKLIKELNLLGIPAYLLGREVEKEKAFDPLRNYLQPFEKYYLLKQEAFGFGVFVNRAPVLGRFDVFISLLQKESHDILQVLREFDPNIHFLVQRVQTGFQAQAGEQEIDEALRAVCIKKLYPQLFYDYLLCRSRSINSVWWDDCIPLGDYQTIKQCARSQEGEALLEENIALNEELQITNGPTYLLDNQEVFSSQATPNKEEIRKLIRKK